MFIDTVYTLWIVAYNNVVFLHENYWYILIGDSLFSNVNFGYEMNAPFLDGQYEAFKI